MIFTTIKVILIGFLDPILKVGARAVERAVSNAVNDAVYETVDKGLRGGLNQAKEAISKSSSSSTTTPVSSTPVQKVNSAPAKEEDTYDDKPFAQKLPKILKRESINLRYRRTSLRILLRPKPEETFKFLGFAFRNYKVDLSDITNQKMKDKIKRKAHALRRWQQKKALTGEKAAKGFVKAMNHKFSDSGDGTEFSWSRWFFPCLTTDEGLKEIGEGITPFPIFL